MHYNGNDHLGDASFGASLSLYLGARLICISLQNSQPHAVPMADSSVLNLLQFSLKFKVV